MNQFIQLIFLDYQYLNCSFVWNYISDFNLDIKRQERKGSVIVSNIFVKAFCSSKFYIFASSLIFKMMKVLAIYLRRKYIMLTNHSSIWERIIKSLIKSLIKYAKINILEIYSLDPLLLNVQSKLINSILNRWCFSHTSNIFV